MEVNRLSRDCATLQPGRDDRSPPAANLAAAVAAPTTYALFELQRSRRTFAVKYEPVITDRERIEAFTAVPKTSTSAAIFDM
ncbi:hypothetical protein, partial [Streptomyces sp. NBC_00503]|uniref:hypothetical protein n=1 Tax=Streptomyces sp. NBC_00503 TaxID=2903659 RepID=UPI002E80FB22